MPRRPRRPSYLPVPTRPEPAYQTRPGRPGTVGKPRGRPPNPLSLRRLDRITEAEQAERAAYPYLPHAPAFAHLVDLAKPGRGVEHAREQVRAIQAVIDRGGWTESEKAQLHTACRKWRRRAEGQDPRYMVVGTRPGALPRAVAAVVNVLSVEQDVLELVRTALSSPPSSEE